MSPLSLFDARFCWFLVLCFCVFWWISGCTRKLLLFGTFCLILFGHWVFSFAAKLGSTGWKATILLSLIMGITDRKGAGVWVTGLLISIRVFVKVRAAYFGCVLLNKTRYIGWKFTILWLALCWTKVPCSQSELNRLGILCRLGLSKSLVSKFFLFELLCLGRSLFRIFWSCFLLLFEHVLQSGDWVYADVQVHYFVWVFFVYIGIRILTYGSVFCSKNCQESAYLVRVCDSSNAIHSGFVWFVLRLFYLGFLIHSVVSIVRVVLLSSGFNIGWDFVGFRGCIICFIFKSPGQLSKAQTGRLVKSFLGMDVGACQAHSTGLVRCHGGFKNQRYKAQAHQWISIIRFRLFAIGYQLLLCGPYAIQSKPNSWGIIFEAMYKRVVVIVWAHYVNWKPSCVAKAHVNWICYVLYYQLWSVPGLNFHQMGLIILAHIAGRLLIFINAFTVGRTYLSAVIVRAIAVSYYCFIEGPPVGLIWNGLKAQCSWVLVIADLIFCCIWAWLVFVLEKDMMPTIICILVGIVCFSFLVDPEVCFGCPSGWSHGGVCPSLYV